MKAFLFSLLTVLSMSSTMAFASLTPDVPGEASLSSDILYISSDAADAIYDRLEVQEVEQGDQIKADFLKKGNGIECNRHMNGSPTECRIKLNTKGVVR